MACGGCSSSVDNKIVSGTDTGEEPSCSRVSDESLNVRSEEPEKTTPVIPEGIETYAYMDIHQFGMHSKLNAGNEKKDWIQVITENHAILRSMVVAFFYRQDIPTALRFFKHMPELVGNHDLDLAIMRAECQLVMLDKRPMKILKDIRDVISSRQPKFNTTDVDSWDAAMKARGRNLGRILLQYAAYHRYIANQSGLSPGPDFETIKEDVQMYCIHSCMRNISDIFIEIGSATIRNTIAPTIMKIFLEIHAEAQKIKRRERAPEMYLMALSCNYVAWISIHVGEDKKGLQHADKGLQIMEHCDRVAWISTPLKEGKMASQHAEKEQAHSSERLMINGDLLANKAVLLANLGKIKEATRHYDEAKLIYQKLERSDMVEELQRTGIRRLSVAKEYYGL